MLSELKKLDRQTLLRYPNLWATGAPRFLLFSLLLGNAVLALFGLTLPARYAASPDFVVGLMRVLCVGLAVVTALWVVRMRRFRFSGQDRPNGRQFMLGLLVGYGCLVSNAFILYAALTANLTARFDLDQLAADRVLIDILSEYDEYDGDRWIVRHEGPVPDLLPEARQMFARYGVPHTTHHKTAQYADGLRTLDMGLNGGKTALVNRLAYAQSRLEQGASRHLTKTYRSWLFDQPFLWFFPLTLLWRILLYRPKGSAPLRH